MSGLPPTPTQDEADAMKLSAHGADSMQPMNVDVPYVSGAGTVGSVLTCTMGNWTGTPSAYAYQWKSDGTTDLAGTAETYTLVATDAGHNITCVVTATNDFGSGAAPPSNAIAVAAGTTQAADAGTHRTRQPGPATR